MTTSSKSSAAAGAAEDTKGGGPAATAVQTANDQDDLRAQLDELRAQLAALKPTEATPVTPAEPQDPTHVIVLACGDSFKLPNPHATHYYCAEHEATVPVTSVFALDTPAAA